MSKTLKIYTDGACLGNPGPGGWAAILIWNNHEKVISGYSKFSTNNKMELTAVIESLKSLKKSVKTQIFTDSKYVMNGISSWIIEWKKNNWKTKSKKPVANKDLWKNLDELIFHYEVSFTWVKGHDGNSLNERCDMIAKEMAKKAQSL